MSKYTTIADDIKVRDESVVSTGMVTADVNADGYLISNGTNREYMAGVSPDMVPLVWIKTNGDPVIIGDDPAQYLDALLLMGDRDESIPYLKNGDLPQAEYNRRVEQGARRLIEVVEHMLALAPTEKDWCEGFGWFSDIARAALRSVAEDRANFSQI